jgi:hypothetical protein
MLEPLIQSRSVVAVLVQYLHQTKMEQTDRTLYLVPQLQQEVVVEAALVWLALTADQVVAAHTIVKWVEQEPLGRETMAEPEVATLGTIPEAVVVALAQ